MGTLLLVVVVPVVWVAIRFAVHIKKWPAPDDWQHPAGRIEPRDHVQPWR